MAIKVKDADGSDKYVSATGAGTVGDPFVMVQSVTASAGTDLNTSALLTQADFDSKVGALTETAPATDTASSGVNGRLQRIAQRLTSLIAQLPAALSASGNLKVAIVEAPATVMVDASGTTVPVSNGGTFAVQAAQSGTWNVSTVTGITNVVHVDDNSSALSVDDGGSSLTVDGAVTATVSHGKTLKTVSGSLTSDTDVIAAVASKRLKVYAYSLITTDNTGTTVMFKSNGTGGTELWRVYLKGPDANTPFGANLSVAAPTFLFATVAGEKLTADVSSGATVHYSIAYCDDDAS